MTQMNLKKLVIYGFGKHENVTIELGKGVNVLYGHNESGKTTIQQFILHVLFGFPSRNSARLRYEPKSGSKYGGQIHLYDALYGNCIIERVRGKSAGDVTVYFGNGKVGGQETLDQLLRQYDRAAFESIFSFSLLQLQGFEKMNEQELSRTLLASGTTGVDHLLQIEATMEKDMDRLFKKQGRNPALNKKLTTLRNLEEALQKELQKANDYAPAVERLAEIEDLLKKIQDQIEASEERYRKLSVQKQHLPLAQKKAALQARLEKLKDHYFPADGMLRYESIVNKLDEAKAAVESIQQKMKQIERQTQQVIDEDKRHELDQLLAEEGAWHRALSSLQTLSENRSQLVERKQRLSARLGLSADDEHASLLTADVSLRKEEELYELLESIQQFHRELEQIEKTQTALQEEQNQLIVRDQHLTPPSPEALVRAEQWPQIQQQIADAKAYLTMQRQQHSQVKTIIYGLLFFMVLVAGYGVIARQYGMLVIAAVGMGAAIIWLKRQQTGEQVKEKEAILTKYEGREKEVSETLERSRVYKSEKETLEERKRAITIDLKRATDSYEELEQKVNEQEQHLQLFLAQYGIDGLPSAHVIPELFRMIREIQECMQELEEVERAYQSVQKKVHEQQLKSEQILQQTIPKEALYEWIRREHQVLMEHARERASLVNQQQELAHARQEKEALVTILQTQIDQLFQEAKVESEESFYQANKRQQEKEAIEQQIEHITMQLIGQPIEDLTLTEAQLENMMEETTEKLTKLRQNQDVLVEEKAILFNKTNALLEDEALSRLQQQLEVERAAFNALAKQWAAKKALATAIQQMMNDLKEKKLPEVLKKASTFFNTFTSGRYEALVITEEGYFEVVAKQGAHFPIIELSQATKEQAYISLRLALALSIVETAPFPIIMDDPFVHFDKKRRSHIIDVLDKLPTHQFIYFTCHEEIKHQWHEATTINVSTIGNQ